MAVPNLQLWGQVMPKVPGPWHLNCDALDCEWTPDRASEEPVPSQIALHLAIDHGYTQSLLDSAVQVYHGDVDTLTWYVDQVPIVKAVLALLGPVYFVLPPTPPGFDLLQIHTQLTGAPVEDISRVLYNLVVMGLVDTTGSVLSMEPMRWWRPEGLKGDTT